MRTYHARVRLNGGLVLVSVQAKNTADARALLEAQYGSGSVATTPTQG